MARDRAISPYANRQLPNHITHLPGPVFNLRDLHHHIASDGTGDQAATIAAIVAQTEGGTVFVARPALHYQLASAIPIANDVHITGQGDGIFGYSRINQSNVAANIFDIDPTTASFVTLRNLTLSRGAQGISVVPSDTTNILNRQSAFEFLNLLGQSDRAINIDGAVVIGTVWRRINIEEGVASAEYGIYSATAEGMNATWFDQLRIQGMIGWAVYLSHTVAATEQRSIGFANATLEHNDGGALRLNRSHALMVQPWFENNGRATGETDVLLEGDATAGSSLTVVGGHFNSKNALQHERIRVTTNNAQIIALGNGWGGANTAITSISGDGATVTVNTIGNHGAASGDSVYLLNAGAYTGWTPPVTMVSTNTFTYAATTTGSVTTGRVVHNVIDVNSNETCRISQLPADGDAAEAIVIDPAEDTIAERLDARKHTITGWAYSNIAANLTNQTVAMNRNGITFVRWDAPFACHVRELRLYLTETQSAGTLTATLRTNAGLALLTATINTATRTAWTQRVRWHTTLAAGDILTLSITTDGSWAPVTADLVAEVRVDY